MDIEGYEALRSVLAETDAKIVPKPKEGENLRFLSAEVRNSFIRTVELLAHYTLNRLDSAGFIEGSQRQSSDHGGLPVLRVLGVTQHLIVFEDLNSREQLPQG